MPKRRGSTRWHSFYKNRGENLMPSQIEVASADRHRRMSDDAAKGEAREKKEKEEGRKPPKPKQEQHEKDKNK